MKKLKLILPILCDGLITLIILTLATIISYLFIDITHNNNNVHICYVLAVVLVSRFTNGYFFGILSSVAGVIGTNYYFTYPYNDFDFTRSGYPVTFIGLLSISLITSIMTGRLKEQIQQSKEREYKTNKLNDINSKLLSLSELPNIINSTLDYVSIFTKNTVIFYLKSPQTGGNGIIKSMHNEHEKLMQSHHEKFIVHWVYENKIPAGVGTEFCGESICTYLPVISHNNIWGVIGIYRENQKPLDDNTLTFLNLMIAQVAMAIERQYLSNSQQQMLLETEKEKMRSNLLRAVSHDLRTPLTAMIGASETLLQNKKQLDEKEQTKLISYIYEDSNWLLHMVENLLSVTRIREGNSSVNKTPEPIEEIVSESIMRIKKRYPNSKVIVKIPSEFIMVPMDATLIEQVIINLLENAIKHSGSIKPIELIVLKEEYHIAFHFVDNGIGIPEDRLNIIFDGYSGDQNRKSDSSKGIGIGLSICKTIIDAHGGKISARNQLSGGAIFTFTLPL